MSPKSPFIKFFNITAIVLWYEFWFGFYLAGNFNYNFPTTTLAPNCSCICSFHNYTDAELQAWIDKLKSELLLNKRALSSNARKKISASDPRASSQAIGSLGALVIVTFIGIIVIPDIPLILKQIKHLSKR